MFNVEGLKAISLVRASTVKQTTGDDNDIPAQRKLNDDFIEREGLIKFREFVEGGVSGFKVKVADRDALTKIKALAEKKSFDILVVYYSDRIGRSSEESPMVIKYLIEKGIRVLSVREGELKYSSQTDKLMTYFMYWNNENESIKIANRSTDYHIGLTQDGKFRGGGGKTIPYGYRTVNRGTLNGKGRNILDFEIDPETAEIVVIIYTLSIENNMGARAIATYLNADDSPYKDKAKTSGGWSFRSIQYILNNPMYKGIFHFDSKLRDEEYLSNEQDSLIIIPEDVWEKNQMVMKNRKTTTSNPRMGITQSRVLLSGLVYCAHCGNKMNVWANYKNYKKKDGDKTVYVKDCYRCPSGTASGRIECDGQKTYSASKIDESVEIETLRFIKEQQNKKLSQEFKESIEKKVIALVKSKKEKEARLIKVQKDIQTLKLEIPNALRNESVYTSVELKELLNDLQVNMDELLVELAKIDDDIRNEKIMVNDYETLDSSLDTWVNRYVNGDVNTKKALLGQVIDKVMVNRDGVDIIYKITIKNFLKHNDKIADLGSEIEPLV